MEKQRIASTFRIVAVLSGGLALGACAHEPGPYLTDARQAYQQAASGTGARYAPDRVYEARVALQQAEKAFEKDHDSNKTKHLAYVAERKAQLATAFGDIEALKQARTQAQTSYAAVLKQQRDLMAERYSTTQEGMEQEREARLAAQQEATEAQEQVSEAQQQTELARREAADALARLEQLASVQKDERGTVITLPGGVLFKTGQATLLPSAEDRLRQVAQALQQQDKNIPIVIEGHTDSRGAAEFNENLSRDRADAVRQFLVQQGVSGDRIKTVGRGENQPVASNDSVEGRAFNRRVEIVVQDGGAMGSKGEGGSRQQQPGQGEPMGQQQGQQQQGQQQQGQGEPMGQQRGQQ